MDIAAPKVSTPYAIGIVAGWVGLALFNVCALLMFGGWVGAADGFVPWSIVAGLLWRGTHALLGLQPLRRSLAGKIILTLWLIFLALAVAGVDERPWAPWPKAVVWVYLVLPLTPAVLLTAALLVRAARQEGRRLTSA